MRSREPHPSPSDPLRASMGMAQQWRCLNRTTTALPSASPFPHQIFHTASKTQLHVPQRMTVDVSGLWILSPSRPLLALLSVLSSRHRLLSPSSPSRYTMPIRSFPRRPKNWTTYIRCWNSFSMAITMKLCQHTYRQCHPWQCKYIRSLGTVITS